SAGSVPATQLSRTEGDLIVRAPVRRVHSLRIAQSFSPIVCLRCGLRLEKNNCHLWQFAVSWGLFTIRRIGPWSLGPREGWEALGKSVLAPPQSESREK